MRPDLTARNQRPGDRDLVLYVNVRWASMACGTKGHDVPAGQRPDTCIDQLAASIDTNPTGTIT